MIKAIIICMTAFIAAAHCLNAQSSLTLSVGGETPLGGGYPFLTGSGPAFSGDYEFRFSKYFSMDAGDQTWLPSGYTITRGGVLTLSSGVGPYTFTPVIPFEVAFRPARVNEIGTLQRVI